MSEKTRWGATPEEWVLFSKTLGLSDYLLPAVSNPKATISPGSKITTVGKLPSIYNSRRQMVGLKEWTNKTPTVGELLKWPREPDYSICVRGVGCNAFDVDIEDHDLSDKVKKFLQGPAQMGALPVRYREDSSKFLMPFRLPVSTGNGKRIIKCSHGIIEWLATGQQWLAAGTHVSGSRYQWLSAYPSDEIDIPTLSMEQAESVWDLLEAEFATEPSAPAKVPRATKMEAIHNTDPLLQTLEERGMTLATESDGRVHITCPFAHEHSSEGSITSTTYFPAHTNGFDSPSIYCLHAHCSDRHTEDYLMELGLVENDFEPLVPSLPVAVEGEDLMLDLVPPRRKSRFNLARAHDFAATGFLIPWHIKGILPKSQVGMVIGPPGSGKTFMVLDLIYSIASGENWRGFKTKQGGVVYFAVEGKDGIKARIKAYEVDKGIDEGNSPPVYITPQHINLSKRDDVLDVIESVNEVGEVAVVVIDTLSSATPGANENAAEDMSLVLANCRYINEMTSDNATVLLVHHTGKDQDRGARGSSALIGAADFQIQIVRNGELRSLKVNKLRDGGDSQELGFRLKMIPIGFDEDEAMVESCVIAHTEEIPLQMPDKVGILERKVIKFLKKMYKRDDFYPDRNSLVEYMVTEAGLKKSNVRRALDSALKKDMVRELEGLITDVQPHEVAEED
jgi:archaellum biogenesis ATPase FlaH